MYSCVLSVSNFSTFATSLNMSAFAKLEIVKANIVIIFFILLNWLRNYGAPNGKPRRRLFNARRGAFQINVLVALRRIFGILAEN